MIRHWLTFSEDMGVNIYNQTRVYSKPGLVFLFADTIPKLHAP